jgi:hemerythrin
MAAINFDEKMHTGIKELDDQHLEIIEQANMLIEAMKEGNGSDALDDLLSDLEKKMENHFKTEENILKLHNYPQLEEQIQEHDKYRAKINEFKRENDSEKNISLPIKVLSLIKEYINNHLRDTDIAYVEFLKKSA